MQYKFVYCYPYFVLIWKESLHWTRECIFINYIIIYYINYINFIVLIHYFCGPSSSVGIATHYGLDGPGIESRWGEILRPSRPALGPTHPPVKWVPGLSRGEVRPGRADDYPPPSSAVVME